jgi:hypothetical protein
MKRPRTADAFFWFFAALATASLGLLLLALAGIVPVERDGTVASEAQTEQTPGESVPTLPPPAPPTTTERQQATGTRNSPTARRVTVVVSASRGDCWILARAGSETGRTLEERVLPEGESLRLRAPRIWLSFGASGNVDVTVNGKPREIVSGTVAVVFEATPST